MSRVCDACSAPFTGLVCPACTTAPMPAITLPPRFPTVPNDTPFTRAGHETECSCGKPYYAHPGFLVADTDHLLLRKLCSGKFVKL